MVAGGDVDVRGAESGVIVAEILVQLPHDAGVTAAVAGDDALVRRGEGDVAILPIGKGEQRQGVAAGVTEQLALGTEQADIPSAAVKGVHGEGYGGTACELHVHHLMIHHVVVGVVDAQTVVGGAQGGQHLLVGGEVVLGDVLGAGAAKPVVILVVVVELHRVVGAGVGGGTAVDTPPGCALRGVLGGEVGQTAEGLHLFAGFVQ